MSSIFLSHYPTSNIPSNFTIANPTDINGYKNGSLEQVFVKDIIGIFSDENIKQFFEDIISKIKIDGLLHIQDIDIEQFCIYFSRKILPIHYKSFLYNQRNNIFDLHTLIHILRQIKNIHIVQANFINGYEFYIRLQKNK